MLFLRWPKRTKKPVDTRLKRDYICTCVSDRPITIKANDAYEAAELCFPDKEYVKVKVVATGEKFQLWREKDIDNWRGMTDNDQAELKDKQSERYGGYIYGGKSII